ncbi:MAG: potassium channel family protein [Cyclobacteriaceae bacterium]
MPSKNLFWVKEYGFIWLLVIVAAVIVATQFSGGSTVHVLFIRTGFYVVMVIGIAASTLSLTLRRVGYGVAAILFLLAIALAVFSSRTFQVVYLLATAVYLIIILIVIVVTIFDGNRMTPNKIIGGVAAYLLLAQMWTALYMAVDLIDPNSFLLGGKPIAEDAMAHLSYFSFITLSTTGYGDVTAIGPLARTLVIFETLIGQLFPAIFIAKLVNAHKGHSKY